MIEGFSPGIIPDRELRAFDWQFSQDSSSVIYKKQSETAGADSRHLLASAWITTT